MTTKITITASPLKLDVEQGFHPNTDLCVDVKTLLRSDRRTRMSKNYMGVLTRDAEDHYTFIESQPSTNGKRNPHVFVGRFITITRQDDGTLRPNFKQRAFGKDFCCGAAEELLKVAGLVESE